MIDAEADLELIVEEQFSHYPAFGPEPELARVQEAARLLAKSRKPTIVAGGGVTASQAQQEVVELAEMRHSDASPIRPERICKELTEFLPSDAILVSDTGHAGIWSGTMIDLKHPRQSYIRSAGSLGWGFPAALGAKCAAPERPVICFSGDGEFWYHIAELETALRWGINTITVVNNNHSLNQTKRGTERAMPASPGIPMGYGSS